MKNELIFGIHSVSSALTHDAENVIRVVYDRARNDKRTDELIALANSLHIKVETADKRGLDKLTDGARHQSVIAECKASKPRGEDELFMDLDQRKKPWLILVLDGVQDPHNLGACLRTADAAGVDAVIAPRDRAAGITPVVRKVAAGAASSVPFYQVVNVKRTLTDLQQAGVWITGTADQVEKSYSDVDYTGSVAIVMGAEEKGMRRLTRELCDELVTLPMAGSVSSLNVSVATGICLYEVVRQRRLKAAL